MVRFFIIKFIFNQSIIYKLCFLEVYLISKKYNKVFILKVIRLDIYVSYSYLIFFCISSELSVYFLQPFMAIFIL